MIQFFAGGLELRSQDGESAVKIPRPRPSSMSKRGHIISGAIPQVCG